MGSTPRLVGGPMLWLSVVSGVSVGAAIAAASSPGRSGQGNLVVEPSEVVAGMFYAGATVHVSAVVPPGAAVALLCRGEEHPLVLNRKGKVLGLIWMNVGEVSFQSVPDVYLLRTSDGAARLAPADVLEELGVGFEALAARSAPGDDQAPHFEELVLLKERDGLWGVAEGAVRLRPAEGGGVVAATDFTLPVKVRPGSYQVLAYAFAGGRGELVGRADVRVRQAGIAAFIASLALRHGLLYGILATLVAVAVGLLTGLVFGLGSKGGH